MLCKPTHVIMLLLFMQAGFKSAEAQNFYIKEKTGTQTIHPFSDMNKLTFSDGKMILHHTAKNTTPHNLSDIRYLSFRDFVSISNVTSWVDSVHIYPNPVTHRLYFSGIHPGERVQVEIFGVEGSSVLKTVSHFSDENPLDISFLTSGIYTCHITSQKSTKILKFIKY